MTVSSSQDRLAPTSTRAVSRRSISAARPTNGVVTASPLRAWAANGDQPERGDRLGLALERQRRDRLDIDPVARKAVGQRPDDDLATTSRLLEPSRRVDRVAGDQPLPGAGVAGDDLAGVHPDVVVQLHAPRRAELVIQGRQRRLHREGRPERTQGVVLVADRQAEDGHDRVADEFLDGPTMPVQGDPHGLEIAGHDLLERLRVGRPTRQRHGLRIGEHDRHGLAAVADGDRRAQHGPAHPAVPEGVRVLLAAGRAQPQPGGRRVGSALAGPADAPRPRRAGRREHPPSGRAV